MELALIPTHDPCVVRAGLNSQANPVFVCPFDNICEGMQDPMRHTCHFPGSFLMADLASYGFTGEAVSVCQDLTAKEAVQFGKRLEQVAEELEKRYPDTEQAPNGALLWANTDPDATDIAVPSEFTEALYIIEGAAAWYQTVGAYGSGVHACRKGFIERDCQAHPASTT